MQLNTDDNRPIELHVKREQTEEYQELDLVNVFLNMGKKKRIYVWLIIACMLVGFLVPYGMAQLQPAAEQVSTVITFLYDGAELEYAPGEAAKLEEDELYEPALINVGEIKSSYVLRNALNSAQLNTSVPIAAIEGNVVIERMLTDASRQSIEKAAKALDVDKKNLAEADSVFYEYSGKYTITLNNGFTTDSRGRHKVYLSESEMSSLLNSIVSAYNDYFFKTYMTMEFPENKTDIIKDESLDYIERLDEMLAFLDDLSAYCTDKNKGDRIYTTSKADGLSLSDISDCINLVRSANVDYLYSYVFYNSVAKSNETMVTRYEYLLRDINNRMDALNGIIQNNEKLIDEFRNDEIIVNLSEQGVGEASTAATDYYNRLIADQAANYEEQSDMRIEAENMQDKLEGLSHRYSYGSQIKYVEGEVNALADLCGRLYDLTNEHAAEILKSEDYRNSFISHIDAQYDSVSRFNKSTIKKMLIGLAAGAFIAFCIWGVDGLCTEFMRGRKDDKAEKTGKTEKAGKGKEEA